MMIGEIDYGSIIVEAKEKVNKQNGAPLVPIPGFTAFVILFFCMVVSVLLMNLLVSYWLLMYTFHDCVPLHSTPSV